ncbi:MAG TPA: hypothetical protein VJH90_00215 [archaeon]|nr:hypothetical protein [archaeon]
MPGKDLIVSKFGKSIEVDYKTLRKIADEAPLERKFTTTYREATYDIYYEPMREIGYQQEYGMGRPVEFKQRGEELIGTRFRVVVESDAREEFKREWILHEIVELDAGTQNIPWQEAGIRIPHVMALEVEAFYARERGWPYKAQNTDLIGKGAIYIPTLHSFSPWNEPPGERCIFCKDNTIIFVSKSNK